MNIEKPIIIISAARSGTKMLRYVLDASRGISSYPYDVNYIWKYGNYNVDHDEILPRSIDDGKKEKIRSFFQKICNKETKTRLLEKSVSNSLRIPFVRSVFPTCKIIHLFRDGLDVTANSRLCWQASAMSERIQSKADMQRKLKEFPFAMAWPYLLDYVVRYGKMILFKQEHISSWGPRYEGIDTDIQRKNLLEVCAIQWVKCVEHCCNELENHIKNVDYINISYEKLVCEPEKYLSRIVDFLEIDDGEKIIERGIKTVKPDFIESWKEKLSEQEETTVLELISKAQNRIKTLN